jgi:hypothetical protein
LKWEFRIWFAIRNSQFAIRTLKDACWREASINRNRDS